MPSWVGLSAMAYSPDRPGSERCVARRERPPDPAQVGVIVALRPLWRGWGVVRRRSAGGLRVVVRGGKRPSIAAWAAIAEGTRVLMLLRSPLLIPQ